MAGSWPGAGSVFPDARGGAPGSRTLRVYGSAVPGWGEDIKVTNVGGHPPASGHLRRSHTYTCLVCAFVRTSTVIVTAMIMMRSQEDE